MTDSTASPSIAPIRLSLADGQAAFAEAVDRARAEEWARRIFEKDTTLWSSNERGPGGHRRPPRLARRAGPFRRRRSARSKAFGEGVRDAGFTTAVVAGMGGSSLAPDVFRRTFGTIEGWLELRVLDSTDPAAVAATVDDLDPLATLWIVASKSGTTTEPLAFLADAWDARRAGAPRPQRRAASTPGEFIVAITDPGKSVDAIPHHDELPRGLPQPARHRRPLLGADATSGSCRRA